MLNRTWAEVCSEWAVGSPDLVCYLYAMIQAETSGVLSQSPNPSGHERCLPVLLRGSDSPKLY